ncbi:uncharacterized protein N7483_003754 [Penicillium malachiteum]|uniref:uncharacterized protein n=1 Tax=Penicillium malachiteum TaxID=1324776 RepID=UPI002547D47C|nr:uncharacterized protein N7483_003754 [Penicillium malachiteum]KAJ5729246.1 hypothetical protein N7483_003754 [Penicillium malachiteum]
MSVSSDLSRCERVYQNQTPWYGNPPPSTKKINRASSIFPKDLKDQDQDWGNFDRTQFWQHYFAPWMNSHSIDILGILPTSELILASSISSEGSANQDQVGGNFNHTRFWHDFFTLWMISESISVFLVKMMTWVGVQNFVWAAGSAMNGIQVYPQNPASFSLWPVFVKAKELMNWQIPKFSGLCSACICIIKYGSQKKGKESIALQLVLYGTNL